MRSAGSRLLLAAAVVLAAAIPAPAGESHTVSRTLEVGGLDRAYRLHVPPGLAPGVPAPLVLVFHGGGGSGAGTERFTRFSDLSDREGFLAAYPDGIGHNWNDGREIAASRAHRERIDDLTFVSAMLEAIAREHPVDARRIYATGISNGGIFSHYLAARLSPRLAAIAPVVGGLADPFHRSFSPERPVSVLIIQGTQDPLVPYHGGDVAGGRGRIIGTAQAVRLWIEHNGASPGPVVEDMPDTDPDDGCTARRFTHARGREGTEVALLRLEGGGHTWPGGAQYLPERVIGRVCRDLDATRLIWEFFKAHPKP